METYAFELMKRLQEQTEVRSYTLAGNQDGSVPSAFRLLAFGLTTAVRLLVRRGGHDVIHAFDLASWPLAWIARLRSQKATVFLSAHGTDVAYAFRPSRRGRLYGAYCRIGVRLLGASHVLANSHATADLVARIGYDRITTIPLAADTPSKGGVVDKSRVLFCGRLTKRKGCGWFLKEVIPLLPNDIVLQIAGRKNDPSEDWVLQHSRTEMLGNLSREELGVAYASALCVIMPNRGGGIETFEGFGLVAPEAARSGAVVIASSVHGLKDAVLDSRTGFLLSPDATQEWADKILTIRGWSDAQRNRFVENSMATAQQYFSWDRVSQQTLASYHSSLESDEKAP